MTEATINSTVGVQLSPDGMASGAKVIERSIDAIIGKLKTATDAAQKAVSEGASAQAKAAAKAASPDKPVAPKE